MIKIIALASVACMVAQADIPLPQPGVPKISQANSKKEKKSPFERGFRFGEYDANATGSQKTKRRAADILEEMLRVQKKQLKVQKKILAILQDQFDPQPKKIIVNGKECIENSTAECFKMPLLHPDGKRIPVLGKFVTNPTVENAKEYLKWHAKFLKNAFKGGEAITLAVNQYGTQAYPMNYNRFEYDTPGAYSTVLKTRNNRAVLNALAGEVEFFFFFGKNSDADAFAVDNYAKFVKAVPNVKYTIVFYNAGAKKVFDALASRLKNVAEFSASAKAKIVSPKSFTANHIYATPMVSLWMIRKKKMRTILVGRTSADGLISNAIDVLEYDELLKDGHSPGFKAWERVGDYSKKHYKEKYGVDLNETFIKQQYKKGQ